MNKRKKVAWHKHLDKQKKLKERRQAEAQQGGTAATPAAPKR